MEWKEGEEAEEKKSWGHGWSMGERNGKWVEKREDVRTNRKERFS